jgi:Na+/proline symporter/nitrogen-specific signal transduction histidine kinase
MLAPATLVAIALAYVGVLFVIAWLGDRRAAAGRRPLAHPWIYSLSLAVYCTAWTFYGSVGRAASDGYGFLPVYLGPTLGCALGWVVYRKILRVAKAERVVSIADFVAARYGKSTGLGAVTTIFLVVGTVPYLALQLKAVSSSFLVLWQETRFEPMAADQLSLVCAALLALFAILFGTRSVDLTDQHAGLVLAIAFESLVKLVAFLALGVFVVWGLYAGPADLFARAAERPELVALMSRADTGEGAWFGITLISLFAFWFLPRQFQVAVVENVDERHLRTSSWLLPLYLLVINAFVLPIALAGRLAGGNAAADTFVLSLPLASGHQGLAVLVFIGGLSAATGMIIVESLALSNMVANDLVLPLLLRRTGPEGAYRFPLLISRRLAIAGVVLLGHLYAVSVAGGASLVTIGLISFAALAQLAPAVLGGIYWAGATRKGAFAGILGGALVWAYTLPLPTLAGGPLLSANFVEQGPFGIDVLRPYGLFGLTGVDPLSHSLLWSLLTNLLLFVGVSSISRQSPVEERQARRFVGALQRNAVAEVPAWRSDTPLAAVRGLLGRFVGEDRADRALGAWAEERGVDLERERYADPELLSFAERLLAGTTGAASAHVALASVASEHVLEVGEVVDLLDETSRVLAASRDLEEKSHELEAATDELRRVNERLQELDRRKDDFLSTMAHELRTPLTSIRAFAEILHDNPDLGLEKRTEFLGIISRENDRLTRLIHGLLDLAKLEADGPIDREGAIDPADPSRAVAIDEVLDEAVASTRQLALARGIDVVRAPHAGPAGEGAPIVAGDRDRLMQVVLNLVSNALRHCPEQTGRVTLHAERVSTGVRFGVSDNGAGVPAAERERIFERFRQLPREGGVRVEGAGLGLAISRRIVEQHGGRIWVEEAAGGGAAFLVELPAWDLITPTAEGPIPVGETA